MKLSIVTQIAGETSVGRVLSEFLQDDSKQFHTLKFLMAYVNSSGLEYINESIERFYNNKGRLEFIVGLDNGLTTYDALKYLVTTFPLASVFAFHDNSPYIVFHPKVIILEGRDETVCILGSTNLTYGGLFSNFEGALILEVDAGENDHLESIATIWETFRNPRPPLSDAHLKPVTLDWLEKNRRNFPTKKQRKQELKKRAAKFRGFGSLKFRKPKSRKLPQGKPARTTQQNTGKRKVAIPGNTLYLEILDETRDGNQVQLPTVVVTSFFNGNLQDPQILHLSIDGKPPRDVTITHYSNNTHRISLHELTGVKRPAFVKFQREEDDEDTYECQILSGADYDEALEHSTEQTRAGSRHWGIE